MGFGLGRGLHLEDIIVLGDKRSPVLRKVWYLATSCFNVSLVKTFERYISAKGVASNSELFEAALTEGFRFPSLAAFNMRLSRLVRNGILVHAGWGLYMLNLNDLETEILNLLYKLCESEVDESEVEGGVEP